MPRKGARQRISYVLPLAESTAGHRLGVNGLAIDEKGGILYSGGRDGVVCAWDLNLPSNPSLDHPRKPVKGSTFRKQIQAHTHWVNDILVSADGQSLVSASSDLTVKLWRAHSQAVDTPQTIGRHSDYVKCLAAPSNFNWIASGGLDRKIRLWDVDGGGEQLVIDVGDDGYNPKGSVYALGAGGHGGSVLASGGPESVVRVWDPRSGERITKFVGHTDNIRSILVSDDGGLILSASSDTTVKLWSLAERRCIHTLSHHNDSVWSLFSRHPRLEIFHSSDRSGLVAKSDLRNTRDLNEGISVAVCQEHEGVSRVIASGDNIWTATSSSSINRWSDVDTDTEIVKTRDAGPPRSHKHRPSGSSVLGSPVLAQRPNIPVNALLRLSSTGAVPSNVRDPDAVTVYSVSSQRRASIPDVDLGIVVPISEAPEETIQGHHGLIKHFILNDRRRVLTVDTSGDVVLWDLLKCCQVKSFGKRELEDVAAEVNTVESVANWCTVNTRTGALTCVLEESTCFDAEMYADQIELENPVDFREDQRINLGKWVLRYLFAELISEEIARDEQWRRTLDVQRVERENIRRANAPPQITLPPAGMFDNGPQSSRSMMTPRANGHGVPQTPALQIGLATPGPFMTPNMMLPNHTGNSSDGSVTGRSSFQATRISTEPKDYFNSTGSGVTRSSQDIPETPSAETPTTEGQSLFGKFRQSLKKGARSMSTDSRIPPTPTAAKTPILPENDSSSTHSSNKDKDDPNHVSEEILAGILQRQRQLYESHLNAFDKKEMLKSAITPSLPTETPILRPPGNTMVIIQDDKPDSGGASDLYRGTVASCGKDAEILERVVPAWLGDLLLYNKIPFKEPVKISFVLVPWHDEMPSISSTADGYVGEGEGPTTLSDHVRNTRLNANRMLRARKIMAYVAERLPFSHLPELPEKEGGPRPEEWLELMCHDKPLDPLQTLATIRAHIWKTGGDILLQYRKKGDIKLGRALGHQTTKRHSGSDSFSSDRDPMSPISHN